MSKKHFIELGRTVAEMRSQMPSEAWETVIQRLGDFCASQNYRFKRDRWVSFIRGECGPNGGAIKRA